MWAAGVPRRVSDQSRPSQRRDEPERDEPHQEAEDTTAGERSTAPQSDYSGKQVGIGFAVLAVGVAVSFGLPLLYPFFG